MTPEQAREILSKNELPDNFCVLPFLGLECKTTGEASVCCVQQESAKDITGKPYNFAETTIDTVFNSAWMDGIRKDFLENKQISSCYNCWDEERAGLTSKRLREVIRFQNRIPEVVNNPEIHYLDLKFGNICNLKCRICTSFASSKWAEDEVRSGIGNKHHADRMIEMGKWPKDNNVFWDNLYSISDKVDTLELFGGEPMLLKEHALYLNKLVEIGGTEDKLLSYNTNGTQDLARYYDTWSKFKKVQVFFSIDGVGDRFTYLRHPAPWEQVNQNIRDLLEHGPKNVEVAFFCSVSAFNIWYLEEVADWAAQYPNCYLHWNMVYAPEHYSAKCLPVGVKEHVRDHLLASKYSEQFKNIVKYIEDQDNSEHFQQFLTWTDKIDQVRQENFAATFPEYAKILNEHQR